MGYEFGSGKVELEVHLVHTSVIIVNDGQGFLVRFLSKQVLKRYM